MNTKNIQFPNRKGDMLDARLEIPASGKAQSYAIFAHCFTCGKNINAAINISRQLSLNGIAVLRFDFSGVGESEGESKDANFSANLHDLESAAEYLKENYEAPKMLIGHSLGGTAVIYAASRIKSIEAICTLAAPFDPEHVKGLFKHKAGEIAEKGMAEVNLGSGKFTVSSEFIDDLEKHNTTENLENLRIPILIFHSPQDRIVDIGNAAKIYNSAFHPKSFISLDGSDHLLSSKKDSKYVAELIANWALRYFTSKGESHQLKTNEDVVVQLSREGFTTEVLAGKHSFIADEPEEFGGNDFGPSPYELLNAALGSCTAMTVKMYANRKGWPLEKVTVHLNHEKMHISDIPKPREKGGKVDHFFRYIDFEGELTEKQIAKLLEIANKCPVHRTLTSKNIQIITELRKESK